MESSDEEDNKKDKKLVFLSKTVLQKVRERPMVTGTQIANEIFELYSEFVQVSQGFLAYFKQLDLQVSFADILILF